jgi:hypothetical protein
MRKVLLSLAIAIVPALASVSSVTCDGITTQGTGSVSCSDEFGAASITLQSFFYGPPESPYGPYVPFSGPEFNVSASGDASASFSANLLIQVAVSSGWFEPYFLDGGSVALTVNGGGIPGGPQTFDSSLIPLSIVASGSSGYAELAGVIFWTPSGSAMYPTYVISDVTPVPLASPEPSGTQLMGTGVLLIFASRLYWRRSPRRK